MTGSTSGLGPLLLHAAATWFMAGVIWMVQLVHYPLFAFTDRARFGAMATAHSERIRWIVGPAMLIELGTALWLLARPPAGAPRALLVAGLALLAVIWISTALLQGPDNGRLVAGFDADVHRRLVTTNWLRTIAWSTRGILVSLLLLQVFRSR